MLRMKALCLAIAMGWTLPAMAPTEAGGDLHPSVFCWSSGARIATVPLARGPPFDRVEFTALCPSIGRLGSTAFCPLFE